MSEVGSQIEPCYLRTVLLASAAIDALQTELRPRLQLFLRLVHPDLVVVDVVAVGEVVGYLRHVLRQLLVQVFGEGEFRDHAILLVVEDVAEQVAHQRVAVDIYQGDGHLGDVGAAVDARSEADGRCGRYGGFLYERLQRCRGVHLRADAACDAVACWGVELPGRGCVDEGGSVEAIFVGHAQILERA